MKTQVVISPNVCVLFAILSLLVGVVEPNSGVAGQYLIGCYCVFRCRLKYLATLIICHINSMDIEVVSSFVRGTRYEFFSILRISDRFLPTFGEVSAVLFCAYFLITLCFHRLIFGNYRLRMIFWFWVLCLAGGFVNSVFSLIEGNFLWAKGLKAVLTVGCFFYGLLLAQRSKFSDDMRLVGKSLWLVLVPGILITLHLFWSHLGFWLVSIASILVFMKLRVKNAALYRLSALAYLPVSVGSTLTLVLISFSSFALAALASSKRKLFKNLAIKSVIFILFLGPTISLGTGFITNSLGLFQDEVIASDDSLGSLNDRIIYKFTADRMPIWSKAYQQIIEGDFLFPTSGRSLDIIYLEKEMEWTFGAHNTYLEILRNNGIFFGSILLIIMYSILTMAFKKRTKHTPISLLFAISMSVTAGIGMLLNEFIVAETLGAIFWASSGVLIWRLHQFSLVAQGNLVKE